MILEELLPPCPVVDLRIHQGPGLAGQLPRLEQYLSARQGPLPLSWHPAWMSILQRSAKHVPYCLEACEGGQTRGFLALAYVRSFLFGPFLVSLPYVNYGGVAADDPGTARLLIDRACELADQLNVRYLELRHIHKHDHPRLNQARSDKVHMRLPLPAASEQLWKQLSPKVRNQVRKGQKSGLSAVWGGAELLPEFYAIFCENMRDLGSPVFSQHLFGGVLQHFPKQAELCVVRDRQRPLAAALLLHGWGVTEVPSASSLRRYNNTCANMLMYWLLLGRAIERGQSFFDFGRSSQESNTFRFKKQWGAEPIPAVWQYYVRTGDVSQMRHDNPRYQRLIRIWRRLPVALTRWIGPAIVRGIP